MNYEITCQLCKHLFSLPVTLNCCSTCVCSDCLSNISYKKDNSLNKFYYNCPFCFKDYEEIETTTPNDFLASFIEYKEKTLQSTCERCEKQTKSDHIVICNECNNKSLCKECSDSIHSVGKFRQHERTSFTSGVMHQLNCITNLMRCETHLKEKIEYVCVKDQQFMCNLCIAGHKQNCKNNIVTIREAYKDLLYQVKLKSEKLKTSLSLLKNDSDSLRNTLEKLQENSENSKKAIQSQFNQLYSALEQKQKEIEFSLEYIFVQRKTEINKEIKEIENSCLWVENLMNITDFAASYQNSSFVAGTKYIFARIDSLMNNINTKKPTNSVDLSAILALQSIDDCKSYISKISLITPTLQHEKSKSKIPTPRVHTPVATPPRSNTPQTNKSARCETTGNTQSPLSRSKDPLKSQRSAFRSSTKHSLDTSINKFNLVFPTDKQEVQVISSRPQAVIPQETVDSPRFSNSQSFASTTRPNEGVTEDDDDEVISNYVKIKKKPLRVNGGPASSLANYLNNLGAHTSSLCSDHGISLQSAFVKAAESKHKRNNLSEVKRSKGTLNESKEDGSSGALCDVNHLTELQKNPLVKRMFTKVAQTATTIFVAWTHPFSTGNLTYQIEYGIGTKVQGVEQFRPVFKGPLHSCIISDLMPKTSYRIRVCPILLKNKENDSDEDTNTKVKKEVVGQWSDIITVTTKESQTIDVESLGNHAKMAARGGDKVQVEFDKSGTIIATNGYTYGKVAWEVKLQQQAAHQMPDDTNAFIKIGVMSRMTKQVNVFGSMINYGLNAHSSTINVMLDLENRILTIQSSNNTNKEVIHNLPDGPLYPAFQNKTNKVANFPVKLFVQFDQPVK